MGKTPPSVWANRIVALLFLVLGGVMLLGDHPVVDVGAIVNLLASVVGAILVGIGALILAVTELPRLRRRRP